MITLKEKTVQTAFKSLTGEEILQDYRIGYRSRQVSLLARREVMSGKAKFGILGDGKEIAQIAMARVFKKGDWRSGYYRDQTFMFAIGECRVEEFFAQLYAHPDLKFDPATAGRAMNAHFATRSLKADGSWNKLAKMYNSSADISPTGGQMPRLVGLAYASKLYRELKSLHQFTEFSNAGKEIAFGTIGNASCAEGVFWESVNAVGVLKAPMVLSIWDDGYGISVANELQITRENLSEALKGFQREPGTSNGFEIYTVKGWDYVALINTYQQAVYTVQEEQVPVIIHVIELTQPQGHSTSGSHERYKSKARLEWEKKYDCLAKMRQWLIEEEIVTEEQIEQLERKEQVSVNRLRERSWQAFIKPILAEAQEVSHIIEKMVENSPHTGKLQQIKSRLLNKPSLLRRDIMVAVREVLLLTRNETLPAKKALIDWKKEQQRLNEARFSSHLYSETSKAATRIPEIKAVYTQKSSLVNGFEVVNACFDAALARDPRIIAFGEDVGKLGDVNQGFKGLQAKYGKLRVSDTGIRESTIIGQAIGMGMRGLRPIAEIQYLDYILYGIQILSDDLATLHWRTKGGQKAPVIIRTRGHRLEGIWHAGSLMAGILHLVRGMHVLVPRNMTQAAGFYNTLLRGDEPAIVVEVLNGYRLKEKLPDNIGEFTVPLGVPEILKSGTDITIVTYGACCHLALEAAEILRKTNIEAEVIDVQSLLPFDTQGVIVESLKKTNRILLLDEDVPGGTTAYMMQEILEQQGGYYWLDSAPRTLPGKPHRTAYGSDGDYFSKPNVEDVFESVYELMHEADPQRYPLFYG